MLVLYACFIWNVFRRNIFKSKQKCGSHLRIMNPFQNTPDFWLSKQKIIDQCKTQSSLHELFCKWNIILLYIFIALCWTEVHIMLQSYTIKIIASSVFTYKLKWRIYYKLSKIDITVKPVLCASLNCFLPLFSSRRLWVIICKQKTSTLAPPFFFLNTVPSFTSQSPFCSYELSVQS